MGILSAGKRKSIIKIFSSRGIPYTKTLGKNNNRAIFLTGLDKAENNIVFNCHKGISFYYFHIYLFIYFLMLSMYSMMILV